MLLPLLPYTYHDRCRLSPLMSSKSLLPFYYYQPFYHSSSLLLSKSLLAFTKPLSIPNPPQLLPQWHYDPMYSYHNSRCLQLHVLPHASAYPIPWSCAFYYMASGCPSFWAQKLTLPHIPPCIPPLAPMQARRSTMCYYIRMFCAHSPSCVLCYMLHVWL